MSSTSISRSKQGLTPSASRFIGRAADLAALRGLFAEGGRLVTLWGPPGMGKTRLATEIALAWSASHDGESARFCELAATRDLDAVCRAVSAVLGAPLTATARGEGRADVTNPVEALGQALAAEGPLLLVLDNFEQILPVAALALERWIWMAPEARFLVTSRERTRLLGEVTYELEPLGLPEAGSAALASDAALLFLDRARAACPSSIVPNEAAACAIAEIVRRLEGIPLSIELAAARFELLGAEGLLARLDSSLSLLSGGVRRAEARLSTLRDAIAWSWDLLDEAECRALAHFSLFRGSFTLDAASAVLGVPDALELVGALRDKSLLRTAPVEGAGAPLLSLYEGVRDFAAERLTERGEREGAEERRATYFLATGEAAANEFARTGAIEARNRITRDLDNLLAVADSALGAPSSSRTAVEQALSALLVADPVLRHRGPVGSYLDSLDRALAAAAQTGVEPRLLLRALAARGRVQIYWGRAPIGSNDLERVRAEAALLGAIDLEASALNDLGFHYFHRERGESRLYFEAALPLHRRSGDRRAEAIALGNLGVIHAEEGRLDDAVRHVEIARAICIELGDARLEGLFSSAMGGIEQERGDFARARRLYARGAILLQEVGDLRYIGSNLIDLAGLHHEEGRLDDARACYERAASLLRDTGARRLESVAHCRLGAVLAGLDRIDEARLALDRGARVASQLEDEVQVAVARLCSGFVDLAEALREPRPEEAARHLASACAKIAEVKTGAPSHADRSNDIRLLLRILEPSVAAMDPAEPTEQALLLALETRWCRPPGEPWQDLRERHTARRLLVALVGHRRGAPGQGMTLSALQDAGWPGEQILAAAAANRIHVALNQLRKLGMKPWIQRTSEGYFLDPGLPIRHVAIDPAGPR